MTIVGEHGNYWAMITYSTNYMGPIYSEWYRERGLMRTRSVVIQSEAVAKVTGHEVGDLVEYEEPLEYYAGGRIDIYGADEYPLEYGLPPMHSEDWKRLSNWLDTIETYNVWTYEDLIGNFERFIGREIRWAPEKRVQCSRCGGINRHSEECDIE